MVRNEACIINIAKTIELVDRCATADKVVPLNGANSMIRGEKVTSGEVWLEPTPVC